NTPGYSTFRCYPDLRVLQIGIRAKVIENQVVAALSIPVSEMIDIGVPIDEDVSALRFRVEIVESENASLLSRIKTLEAINMITHSQERRTRSRMEQQLALVGETLRGMRVEMGALRAQQRQGVRAPESHDTPEDANSHTKLFHATFSR
ncbi:hypothetical protein Tco_1560175, partial [Tanacetum coccineum]